MRTKPIDQLAEDLRYALCEKHSSLCKDTPNAAEHIAEAFVLELIHDAVRLRDRIRSGDIK